MDANKPVTNPDLLAVIELFLKNPTNENQLRFFEELKKAHFLSPVIFTPQTPADENGTIILAENTKINFLSLTNAANEAFLPVFTDWQELRKWRNEPNEQTIITIYEDLSSLTKNNAAGSGFVLNPFGCNLIVNRDTIDHINNRQHPAVVQTIQKETQVKIGTPQNYPDELIKAISAHLKTKPNVNNAYLVLMQKDNEISYLVVVDFIGDRQETFNAIAAVAVPLLKPGELLDMVAIDDSLGQTVARDYPPFYQK